jgi:hypothetical protein
MKAEIILRRIEWVVCEPPAGRRGPGADFVCTRCGRRDAMPVPMPVSALVYFTRGFQEFHRWCKEAKP